MTRNENFDVMIIGGSYAGLSAAMALGRALRNVLVIDSGQPCNRQTPHSHNLITQDGQTPGAIAQKAKEQVQQYDTIRFLAGLAISGRKTETGFEIKIQTGELFTSSKLLFTTGLQDIMPAIKGFSECWGISILHCPYCHGYEVKKEKTGIIANGDIAFHYAQLISNWTPDLVLFTNGKATFTEEQTQKISKHQIAIVEKEIDYLAHENGHLQQVVFKDGSAYPLKAIYARPAYEQHCNIPATLGCEFTEQGLLKVDIFQKTTVEGVYAGGDNSGMRALAAAIAAGTMAGAAINNKLREEFFNS